MLINPIHLLYLAIVLIIKHIKELQIFLSKQEGTIGFAPTMGALHQGHISLIDASNKENQTTVCSIFVNPTQFNDKKDFDKYPVTLENDIKLLIDAGCDVLFLPTVEEMYPNGTVVTSTYEIGYLDTVLEGEFRPGHFNGVAMIVHKLLQAVMPTNLYMGEKDFQQCMVVKQLIAQFNLNVNLKTCATLREESGLAMSSRNMRLSDMGRQKAAAIYTCLSEIKAKQHDVTFEQLHAEANEHLIKVGFEPEYIKLANADNLNLLADFDFEHPMVVLITARLEGIRLIDNMRM
jgi:pantoate--beta-alanine ligase